MRILFIILLCSSFVNAQKYNPWRVAPTAGAYFVAGVGSNMADIASTPAKYNQSKFKQWNPEWQYPEYLGHKDETWVNKYKYIGDHRTDWERFPLSKNAFVGFTDLWHGGRTVMKTGFATGTVLYGWQTARHMQKYEPPKWWHYAIDFAVCSVAYSAGWHTSDLIFMQ